MYRIMLADDEGIVLDALKFIIEKNFGDTCQVETAKTGRSVIELAEQFSPDIALMDIQMPGINGIEAIKEIRKRNKSTQFIIVSAYDKFDYAKEAINLGVVDYINKPIRQDVIVEVLKKAMKTLDTERHKRSSDLMIREKLENVVPVIESGFIYSILFQEHFEEDTNNYKQLLGMEEYENGYMMAIIFGDSQQENHMTNAVGAGVRIQNHYRDIRELIKSYFPRIVGNVMANKIAVFMPCKEESFDYEQRIEMIEKSRELARKLRAKADVVFRIGIGSVKSIKVTCMLAGVLACVIFIALQIKNRKDRAKKGYELNSLSGTIAKTVVICAAVLAFMYKLALHKGIPYVLVWVVVIVLIYSYITSKTTTGRYFYAVGGNEKATKLSGINTNKVYFLAYLNMAFLAAVAGMITIARLNSANPTAGTNYEMDAIGSCFIGGASAYGGTGTVPGVINLGMNIMGVDANYQKVVKGLVLLAAVIFDVVSKKKQS